MVIKILTVCSSDMLLTFYRADSTASGSLFEAHQLCILSLVLVLFLHAMATTISSPSDCQVLLQKTLQKEKTNELVSHFNAGFCCFLLEDFCFYTFRTIANMSY